MSDAEERKVAQDPTQRRTMLEKNATTTVDLRRVYTMPAATSAAAPDFVAALRHSKSETLDEAKLDRFGFILNMDSHGNIHEDYDGDDDEHNADRVPTFAQAKRNERRIKKWDKMMSAWGVFKRRRHKLVVKRLRKGLPDSIRGKVWALLGDIQTKIDKNPGLYNRLVRETIVHPEATTTTTTTSARNGVINHTKSFRNLQETIERDIHRTFPRHAMFYDIDHNSSEKSGSDENNGNGICGSTNEIASMIRELELSSGYKRQSSSASNGGRLSPQNVLEDVGGQASLRRVLKAYSLYDKEIGYCQGMNFIAGMFLTLLSEEESFWLLVAVMYDEPCKMRGLFGEGMKETHKALYVAEKLIQLFLPKLSKHLEREHIHITMFATQWLLTQYTSSFRFDLVTRVWDCFLEEGWKVTYRVMLALLMQSQSALLKMGFEDILAFFRELPDRVEGAPIVDAAMKIPLRRKQIIKYEKEWDAQQAQRASS